MCVVTFPVLHCSELCCRWTRHYANRPLPSQTKPTDPSHPHQIPSLHPNIQPPYWCALDPFNSTSKITNLLTCKGYTGGFNEQQTDRDHPFDAANQPATLPRVSVMHIVTERSPWCTTVRNESGVTLGDICGQMHKE